MLPKRVLAIETSCDETAAAVVQDGRFILSNVVISQEELHRRFGGIVPELASRQHLLGITPAIEKALAGVGWDDVDAVAVTYGPGLVGSLLVGLNAAKALALARERPLVGVNHLEGHVYANWLVKPGHESADPPQFPLLCLVVSGGHSELVLMEDHGRYRLLGRTRDDAAGEAFDKVARILGLGYPGGPAIQRAWLRTLDRGGGTRSKGGVKLTRPWLRGSYDFSFSGVKTAMLRLVEASAGATQGSEPVGNPSKLNTVARDVASDEKALDPEYADELAAAFQEVMVDVLVGKTCRAATDLGVTQIALAGGVAANRRLRERLLEDAPVPVRIPDVDLCTDNAAMIGACGFFRLARGERAGLELDVQPSLRLA